MKGAAGGGIGPPQTEYLGENRVPLYNVTGFTLFFSPLFPHEEESGYGTEV